MLHLVGVTKGLTAQKAVREYQSTRLVRLYHGVYCDDDDLKDLAGFMRRNAVRIANYIFPDAVLTQASAYYKGAVECTDSVPEEPRFRLFVGGGYSRTVKMRYLEIVQSHALRNENIKRACVPMDDGQESQFGRISMLCAADELVFLQNFARRRYNLERFLDDKTILDLRRTLEARHGDELTTRLRAVADACGDYMEELDKALAMLRTPIEKLSQEGTVANIHEFTMAWYRRPIAKLAYNGVHWNFDYEDGWMLPLSCEKTVPGQTPQFILNLFPEGHQMDALRSRMLNHATHATVLSNSERYLTNVAIVDDAERLKVIPVDALAGRLADFSVDGTFNGRMAGVPEIGPRFMAELNDLITDRGMPRMSGTQAKIPSYLSEDGVLSPATNVPFTHILKLPGVSNDYHWLRGAIEWTSMTLARGSGLKTADFSLVQLSNDAVAYVTERFDVPTSQDDMRMIVCEDMCSAMGLGPQAKVMMTAENLVDSFKALASHPKEDGEELFRLFYVNYLLENGDFHLKNAALLKVANPMLDSFRSVRLAPAFDIMCTAFFHDFPRPPEERERMVLWLGDNDGDYSAADFVKLAERIGIDADRANVIMKESALGIAATAVRLEQNLPELLTLNDKVRSSVMHTLERARLRCKEAFPELQAQASAQSEDEESPRQGRKRVALGMR